MANQKETRKVAKRPVKAKPAPRPVQRKPVKSRPQKVSRGSSGPGLFRRIITSVWTWRIILFGLIIALLVWQWDNFTNIINNLLTGTYGLLGWG
jgi:hypothetical protein